jgi:hypothetical protein
MCGSSQQTKVYERDLVAGACSCYACPRPTVLRTRPCARSVLFPIVISRLTVVVARQAACLVRHRDHCLFFFFFLLLCIHHTPATSTRPRPANHQPTRRHPLINTTEESERDEISIHCLTEHGKQPEPKRLDSSNHDDDLKLAHPAGTGSPQPAQQCVGVSRHFCFLPACQQCSIPLPTHLHLLVSVLPSNLFLSFCLRACAVAALASRALSVTVDTTREAVVSMMFILFPHTDPSR